MRELSDCPIGRTYWTDRAVKKLLHQSNRAKGEIGSGNDQSKVTIVELHGCSTHGSSHQEAPWLFSVVCNTVVAKYEH